MRLVLPTAPSPTSTHLPCAPLPPRSGSSPRMTDLCSESPRGTGGTAVPGAGLYFSTSLGGHRRRHWSVQRFQRFISLVKRERSTSLRFQRGRHSIIWQGQKSAKSYISNQEVFTLSGYEDKIYTKPTRTLPLCPHEASHPPPLSKTDLSEHFPPKHRGCASMHSPPHIR